MSIAPTSPPTTTTPPVHDSAGPSVHAGADNRLFHGWAMLAVATAALIATGPGQTVIVSQFNASFRADLDLSASALGAAYMLGTIAAAFPLVLVGKLSDRFGPRAVMGVVAILFGVACAATGLVRGVAALTLAFFFLRFLGQGALGLVSGHTLALWFERRLGTANGLKLMGANLAFAAMPAGVLFLIDGVGWRLAYPILGGAVVLLVLPLVVLVARNHPEDVGQRIDGDPLRDPPGHEHDDESPEFDPTGHRHIDPAFTLKAALATWSFWIIALTMALNGLIGTALIFHAQPLAEFHQGDAATAAAAVSAWSLTMMLSVFPAGRLADRVTPRVLLPLSLVFLALASLIPIFAQSAGLMMPAMIVFGLSQSFSMAAGTPAIARYFGRAHHGAIRATATLIAVVGTGLGPVVLGVSIDQTGAFTAGLVLFAAACAPLALAGLFLRRPQPLRARA